jgi:predicted O-methyltransferase YrrM
MTNICAVLDVGSGAGFFTAAMWAYAVDRRGAVTVIEPSTDSMAPAREQLARLSRNNLNILNGDVLHLLPSLGADKPYDIVFIDGERADNQKYLQAILKASKPGARQRILRRGGLIVVDDTPQPRLDEGVETSYEHVEECSRTENYFLKSPSGTDSLGQIMHGNSRIETVLMPLVKGLVMGRLID